jgi:protein O-mannosyl-transferase
MINRKYLPYIFGLFLLIPIMYLYYWATFEKDSGVEAEWATADKEGNTKSEIIDRLPENSNALEKAIMLVKQAPSSDNYINLSLEYYNASRYHDCVYAARKALDYKPDNAIAYNNICASYNALGWYAEAEKACRKALEIDNTFELAENNLKASENGLNEYNGKLEKLQLLTEQQPTTNNFIALGNLYYSSGRYEAAANTYQKVLAVDPDNSAAYNNICSAYNALGEYSKALPFCKKAVALEPEWQLAKNNLQVAIDNL